MDFPSPEVFVLLAGVAARGLPVSRLAAWVCRNRLAGTGVDEDVAAFAAGVTAEAAAAAAAAGPAGVAAAAAAGVTAGPGAIAAAGVRKGLPSR